MTQSTNQLVFVSPDKQSAFESELAVPALPGELPNTPSRKMKRTAREAADSPETMTEAARAKLDQERQRHNKVLVLIAGYKFFLALLFIAIGFGALHLLHKDIDDMLSQLPAVQRFPESRFVNFLLDKASLVNDPMLRRIGAASFAYGGVCMLLAIGLYLEKAWGEYLTLAITVSFLPWEILEIAHRVTWLRVGLLGINVLVFIYLLRLLLHRRKAASKSASQ